MAQSRTSNSARLVLPFLRCQHPGKTLSSRTSPTRYSIRPLSSSTSPVNFNDTRVAFSNVSSTRLLRALLVFKACSLKSFVANADRLLKTSYLILGKSLTEAIVRRTFFSHFCAGETAETIKPTVDGLQYVDNLFLHAVYYFYHSSRWCQLMQYSVFRIQLS